jgi:hypothetical protein
MKSKVSKLAVTESDFYVQLEKLTSNLYCEAISMHPFGEP